MLTYQGTKQKDYFLGIISDSCDDDDHDHAHQRLVCTYCHRMNRQNLYISEGRSGVSWRAGEGNSGDAEGALA